MFRIKTEGAGTKQTKALELETKKDLDNEFYAIASNSIDKIAMGGEEKKVDTHVLASVEGGLDLSEPFLAVQCSSAI